MDAEKFKELLAKARAKASNREIVEGADSLNNLMETEKVAVVDTTSLGIGASTTDEEVEEVVTELLDTSSSPVEGRKILGVARDDITLNEKQSAFLDTVLSGTDCVLIGAAGTGKTTSMRATTRSLISSGRLSALTRGSKYLIAGRPGGAILSYTRKAVNNIRHAVVDELKPHTLTIHKLLEFAPIFYEIEDPDNKGFFKKTMRFEPTRNQSNPLPPDLVFLAFEESSMISVELYKQLQDAMPHAHQEVFLGDIQQLPPIFGLAILGFKMVELPVIELTEVYRQARNSPIIDLAWKILEGNPKIFDPKLESYKEVVRGKEVTKYRAPALAAFNKKNEDGEVKFQIWQKKLSPDNGLFTAVKQFCAWEESGYYDPENDIILCPFNKAFGTIELNKGIMQHLGKKREATVYEVIAGFNKHYLAVGDRVLYDKEDAYITGIRSNGQYLGKRAQPASTQLDRWGHLINEMTEQEKLQAKIEDSEIDLAAIENFMESSVQEDRVQAASHVVTIKMAYSDDEGDDEIILDGAMEINNLLGGYALTVHKYQGSENDRVFFVTHNSHAVLNQREMLYTAVTRAKKFLHIIAENITFANGIKSQRVKGDTIEEKAAFFKGKKEEVEKAEREGTLALELQHHKLEAVREDVGPRTVIIGGKPAIKLEDLPSNELKNRATIALQHHWYRAQEIFGDDIGEVPTLSYDMRRTNVVGMAYFQRHHIKLNPVWLAAGSKDSEVLDKMLNHTIPHEVCHLVAGKKWKDYKHGAYWKVAMLKMGFKTSGRDSMPGLPDWAASKNELLKEMFTEAGLTAPLPETVETEEDGVE